MFDSPNLELARVQIEAEVVAETKRGIVVRAPLRSWRVGGRRRRVVVTVNQDTTAKQTAAELRALIDQMEAS